MADDGLALADRRGEAVLTRTNALLETLGFGDRTFSRPADLVASVSSMSVALYEKMFQFRLRGVVRVPRTLQDYERNAQLVVDALAGALLEPTGAGDQERALGRSAKPLTGRKLCSGDWDAILQLVERLEQVYAILYDVDGTFRGGELPVGDVKVLDGALLTTDEAENPQSKAKKRGDRLPESSAAATAPRRKAKRKCVPASTLRRRLRDNSGSDGGSEDERPRSRLLDRRAPKTLGVMVDKPSSSARGERKQTEIRTSGAVETGIERPPRESTSRPLSASSSSSSHSSRSSSRRLAQSLVVEHQTRAGHDLLSKSTSSMQKRSNDATLGTTIRSSTRRSLSRSEKAPRSAASRPSRHHKVSDEERAITAEVELQDVESELLRTQKYGRFVGSDAPRARSMRTRSISTELRDSPGPPPFGDLSSVSIASKTSQHFIDEDTGLEHDFSAISLDSAGRRGPDRREASDGDGVRTGSRRTNEAFPEEKLHEDQNLQPTNPNQQEAAGDNYSNEEGRSSDDSDHETADPVKKKGDRDEPSASVLSASSRVSKRGGHAKPLHPLLPPSRARATASKAQAEYLRYKLTLKNHLQELRQRESCQRQHMERAYKAGEHMANVDKIRARRFEQDIRLQRIAVGLEAKEEEEKQLRHAMHHLLGLEKEKLREEHRVTTSVLRQIQKDHQEREQAMENFYANRIRLVREQTEREAMERELMEKAHRKVSEQMMREMRHERESQLAALLQEKQQLAEARRFRQASHMTQLLERTDQQSAARTDAFYTAAMKARHRRGEPPQASAPSDLHRQRPRQAPASFYRTARAARPSSSVSNGKPAPLGRSTRVY